MSGDEINVTVGTERLALSELSIATSRCMKGRVPPLNLYEYQHLVTLSGFSPLKALP